MLVFYLGEIASYFKIYQKNNSHSKDKISGTELFMFSIYKNKCDMSHLEYMLFKTYLNMYLCIRGQNLVIDFKTKGTIIFGFNSFLEEVLEWTIALPDIPAIVRTKVNWPPMNEELGFYL